MTFKTLTDYFERLEETSSRLSLIDILCQLFKEAKSDEVAEICYLIQGRVAPFYEPIEIGMAEKTVAEAIARAFGSSKDKILKDYGRVGDLGKVALKLAEKHSSKGTSIDTVFRILTEVAKTSGDGTVEKKLSLLADLLKGCSAIEAKHLVRIPLGTSRLGIGDPTILDSFAKLKLGDRSKRKLLEEAYNRVSDLGLIGQTLWEKGLTGVEKLEVVVGRPIRSELCERLPGPEKVIEKMEEVNVQRKFDGFRCITGLTQIYIKGKGITAVRDVHVGDKVLTEKGVYKTILAKNKRTIKNGEKLFNFQTYLGIGIKISEGHQLLALVNQQEKWIRIEEIKAGDQLIFPIPVFPPNNPHPAPNSLELQTISGYKKDFNLNENFYRFLGFWIGDGFTNNYHNTERIGLLFNAKKEQGLAEFYESILLNELQVPKITHYTHRGCLSLYWRDEPLKHWLSTYFRKDWSGKTLPEWFSHISRENFIQFLQGWIESDGHKDKDGVIKIVTKERNLATFAQLIALSFGIIIGLRSKRATYKYKDSSYKKTCYELIIPKTKNKAWIQKNRIIVKVLRNQELLSRDPRTQLFDIQVEDDKSFCIPMATLHNCQIHKDGDKVRLFSRNLEETTPMFPELVTGVKDQVKAKSVILDSEAIGFNPESSEFLMFQETTQRRRKYGIEETAKKIPLKAFCFDILYKNGQSLIDTPLSKRLEILEDTIKVGETLKVEKGIKVNNPKKLQQMLDESISEGLEGLVVKRFDSKYEAGARNFNWVKLKRHSSGELKDTIDCVILGYIFGRGKRASFGAGALLVGVYDKKRDEFVTVSKIGTGLSDEEWREIHKRADKIRVDQKPARVNSLITPSVWVKPEIVIEVLADEITRSPLHSAGKVGEESGFALRFPRLVSFRDKDKKAEDATTVDELVKMFKSQGKG